MRILLLLCFSAALASTGCVTNNFAKYYTDLTGGVPIDSFAAAPTGDGPQILPGSGISNALDDGTAMARKGYVQIGYSSFNADAKGGAKSHLIAQARRVGATHIIVYGQYTHTNSGSTPLIVQNAPQRTTTQHSGSAYGSGGSATYSGRSNSTTYGGRTVTQVPFNVARFDYGATYWVKGKPPSFGVHWSPLSDETRSRLGTNHGCEINLVLDDTAAFDADVLPGDVLISVDGKSVRTVDECLAEVGAHAGETIEMGFVRGVDQRVVDVSLRKP